MPPRETMLAIADRPSAIAPAKRTVLSRWLIVEAALLGGLADASLRALSLGAGWTLWIAGIVVTLVVLARRFDVLLNREHKLWLALATICATLFAWRESEALQFFNVVATLVALAMFSMSMAGARGSAFVARIRDVAVALARTAIQTLTGAATLLGRDAAIGEATHGMAEGRMPQVRAVLLTIPPIIVLGKLLGAADPVFGRLFTVPDVAFGSVASHLIFSGVFAWFSAGWMRAVFVGEKRITLPPPQIGIGIVEVSTLLASVNVLFGLFVGMQVRWLFGGASVVRDTTGLSVAEYARSGFFELVAVAALVLPLLLVSRTLVETDAEAVRRHRRLALPMLGLLGAIMVSAVSRMAYYVSAYGLTTDRLFALAFMAWLAGVFGCMAVTVLRDRGRRFASFALLSGVGILGALDIANPEAIVARQQLGRSRATLPVDWAYLSRLSGDALPIVVPALAAAEPSGVTCTAARSLMRRFANETPFEIASFNIGARAGRDVVLRSIKPHSLRRLCVSSTTSPSVSLSR